MAKGDFFIHLREIQHSGRVEWLRQVSIISLAGLGFNLVWIRGEILKAGLQWDDPRVVFWFLCCVCFLLTLLGVLIELYLIPRQAQAQGDLYARRMSADLKNLLSEKEKRLRKRLRITGIFIAFNLTYAVLYTSMVLLVDFLPFFKEV